MAATPTIRATTYETVNWASGLLAATKRLTVFGTVHAPLIHPVIAAKEFVTADHIGEGRFGLNVVVRLERGRVRDVRRRPSATTRRVTTTHRNGSTPSR